MAVLLVNLGLHDLRKLWQGVDTIIIDEASIPDTEAGSLSTERFMAMRFLVAQVS